MPATNQLLPQSLAVFVALASGASLAACGSSPLPDPGASDVHVAAVAPPSVSGGTLTVSRDGRTAFAADPDRDRVWVVDLEKRTLRHAIALTSGDEPGRVVEGSEGSLYVALRNAAVVASIDVTSGTVKARLPTCREPRGLAYDAENDALHVACESGELVTFTSGMETRRIQLDRDLRDVLVDGTRLVVTRFRSAELLVIDEDGKVTQRVTPASMSSSVAPSKFGSAMGGDFTPAVAWRAVRKPDGGFVMAHQRGFAMPIPLSEPSSYGNTGGGCGGIVQSTITVFPSGAASGHAIAPSKSDIAVGPALQGALPVDLAVGPGGVTAVALAGNDGVVLVPASMPPNQGDCGGLPSIPVDGQPTAVAFDASGRLLVQTREPSRLLVLGGNTEALNVVDRIELPGDSVLDTGHEMFHRPARGPGGSLACASCHPEGREDGRVWRFSTDPATAAAPRRTQSLAGGVLDTAPLHWTGDLHDMTDVMGEVFVRRMGGSAPGPRHVRAFAGWVQTLRPIAADGAETPSTARGREIFHRSETACATCHGGARMTNDETMDVGTGDHGPEAFQVPSLLGLASRAPYMHDGAAATIRDRFIPAIGGGDAHGRTSQLSSGELDDLVAYLESL